MEKIGSEKKRMKSLTQEKDLDCTNAGRKIWLVKVPKYVSSRWNNAPPGSEAGRIKIAELPNGKSDIKFYIAEETLTNQSSSEAKTDIPIEHQFVLSTVSNQTCAVFSENRGDENSHLNGSDVVSSKLTLEGVVNRRGECRPLADKKYMGLKKLSIMKASEPERKVKQLRKVVQAYKPVNSHKHLVEFEQKKKNEGKKAREDKDKVMEMLFAAFEKHQYYNIKDLEKITKQPITYLKEILKEICNYNAKNPHKSMWELKPEYRCYKQEEI